MPNPLTENLPPLILEQLLSQEPIKLPVEAAMLKIYLAHH